MSQYHFHRQWGKSYLKIPNLSPLYKLWTTCWLDLVSWDTVMAREGPGGCSLHPVPRWLVQKPGLHASHSPEHLASSLPSLPSAQQAPKFRARASRGGGWGDVSGREAVSWGARSVSQDRGRGGREGHTDPGARFLLSQDSLK